MRKLSARIFIRLTPEQLAALEDLARLRHVPVASYARSIIEDWLSDGASGRENELARISKNFRRPVIRARGS